MRGIALTVMLFAAMPAAARPLPTSGVDVDYQRLAADRKALEDRIYGEPAGVRYTFSAAFVRGLTLGVSEVIARHYEDGFPVLGDASKINPRASLAGTALGFLLLVSFVYALLARPLWRRRAARKKAADRLYEPVEHVAIVGSFVTRDGYEFVVMRSPRKLDN